MSNASPQKSMSGSASVRSIPSLTPHTPVSSRLSGGAGTYTPLSGSSSLHQVDEALVFEIGARFLRAGFANEASPRCVIGVHPEHFGRVGLKGKGGTRMNAKTGEKAGPRVQVSGSEPWELWSMDLRDKDIGVIEDLLERILREAYNKYLLTDSKSKRLLISIHPLLPIPIQTCLTQVLFTHFQPPTITYLPSPVLSTIAAGLRSALVVDIGWHETTITPVYEFRPIIAGIKTSRRGSKALIERTGELVWNAIKENDDKEEWWRRLEWEQIDDLVTRICWVQKSKEAKQEKRRRACKALGVSETVTQSHATEKFYDGSENEDEDDDEDDDEFHEFEAGNVIDDTVIKVTLDTPSLPQTQTTLSIPFKSFSYPAELAFFSSSAIASTSILDSDIIPLADPIELLTSDIHNVDLEDDGDQTLPLLIFSSLLKANVDVRAACLPRVVITGGASYTPGLKSRIINDVRDLVKARDGWNAVRPRRIYGDARRDVLTEEEPEEKLSDLLESEKENLRIQHIKTGGVPRGTIRGVETLGSWAGASLIAGARIKGAVEVEKDKFLATTANGGSGFSYSW